MRSTLEDALARLSPTDLDWAQVTLWIWDLGSGT